MVGGISRTAQRDGWRFDIGGHRFFTKVQPVEDLWHEILPDEDFLMRPRKSRIFYNGKYFDYPLKASNALKNLGTIEAVLCVLSYAWARVRPPKDQTNYEGWLVARFGWRLYRTFFKTYTEKLWGVPVSEMPADWAAQRVKGLSLGNAIMNALLPKRNQKEHHLAHRGVPVPQVRARDDVGGLPRQGRGAGLQGRHGDLGHQGQPRRRQGHQRRGHPQGRRHHRPTRPPRSSPRCRSRTCSRPWTRRCPPRSRRPPRTCATATT